MKENHYMRPGTTLSKEIKAKGEKEEAKALKEISPKGFAKCMLCSKLITQNHLKRHMLNKHGNDDRKDAEDPKAEINWSDLLSGDIKTQNGEKIHKCNQCGYASNRESNLRMHLKRHSGEKSNKCNQ